MNDLHTHTTASDGTSSPVELIEQAQAIGLEALSICDHDTLSGYDAAAGPALELGLDLVCGIELSTKLDQRESGRRKTVHLLGYFLNGGPTQAFRDWLGLLQEYRRDRNRRLVARLRSVGIEITLEEVEAIGRSMTGRPHFATLMVQKGQVRSRQEAFDLYLDERGKAFVEHESPSLAEGIRRIREGGGLTVLAHPIRLGKRNPADEEEILRGMCDAGLPGIEVFHSDHAPEDVQRYATLARRHGLAVTGGSDFHGDNKPNVHLGSGRHGNLDIPKAVLDKLRESHRG